MQYLTKQERSSLQNHLAAYQEKNNLQEIHVTHRTLDEEAFYPPHDKRRETPAYKAIHQKLCVEMDLPCLICGVRNSVLADKAKASDESLNPYGAKAMETHHHVIEWALTNAIDVDKFNKVLLPALKNRHPDKEEYRKDFTQEDIINWVDHSPDNLWVLCDVHHRHKYLGIHAITYPIWGPQDLLIKDFEEYVRKQLLEK
jgi:hypothetical protein